VARLADRSNFGGKPAEFTHKCRGAGPALPRRSAATTTTIEKTWSPEVFVRETEDELRPSAGRPSASRSTAGRPATWWARPTRSSRRSTPTSEMGVSSIIAWNRDYPSTETLTLVGEQVIPAVQLVVYHARDRFHGLNAVRGPYL
jgi:hypothetical protein